jgi:uncharacterized membrane protein
MFFSFTVSTQSCDLDSVLLQARDMEAVQDQAWTKNRFWGKWQHRKSGVVIFFLGIGLVFFPEKLVW